MAAEAPRSSSSADSYIGSLISLTSKSEIRYEGVLYNINTDESSIGLRNVRSFGTEGRKKDGPQVPGSDKIYEYILFRGSDIKDLQVKSSPPSVQTMASINNDPAIIQSHYPRPVSTSTSLSADASGSLTDPSSHNPQVVGPGPNFQGGLPLYQPAGNVGSWGPSPPPPNANGSSLAMPVYWQGFYGPPNGLPHMHQQSLLRPPPGLSMPPPMQQPMQYPGFSATVQPGGTNLPGSNIAELPPGLLPANTSSLNLISTSLSLSPLPSTMPPVPSATLASELLPSLTPNKTPSSAFSASTLGVSLPSLTPLTTSTSDVSAFKPPISSNSNAVSAPSVPFQNTFSAPSLPFQAISQSISPIVGTSSSSLVENSAPSLVTPGQLLQSGPTKSRSTVIPSPKSPQVAHKDVEVVQVSSSLLAEPSVAVSREAQPPILPLPVPARALPKLNGAAFQHRPSYRGRERGRGPGSSRPVTTFTEDFDFTAMNEKFKKDEVWGHLGKSNKLNSRDKEEDGNLSDEEEYQDEDDTEVPKVEVKPLYNKDDFFDSLSSNALDRESHVGRTRFSEQMKIDTETFGDFPRNRGGRGGRGPNRGGRGSYYGGRGYGYSYGYAGRGRGRGWGMSGRAP